MGGIPWGAFSGPLHNPFSSLSSPGNNSISDEHFPIVVNGSKAFSTICQVMGQRIFSLMVEASLMFMPFSRQEQIAKDGDPAAWTLSMNSKTHFTLVQDHRTC